jgi:DNA-binding transcriptional LysR family regulator
MLDLQHLKTFLVVAATKNFSRAAIELGCSQASVTHRIQALERELGARLFDRFRFARTVVLTDAGGRIYEYGRRLLALAEETKAAVRPKENSVSQGDAIDPKGPADLAPKSR